MPPHPVIVPLSSVPGPALRASVAALQTHYGLTPSIGNPGPIPTEPIDDGNVDADADADTDTDAGRSRYRPRPILAALATQSRPTTDADVSTPAASNGDAAPARDSAPGTATGSTRAASPGPTPDEKATPHLTVALTDAALSHPELGEVFGLAHLDAPECIISTRLLRLTAHSSLSSATADRFACRVRKMVVHEVGHTLGLPHCEAVGCVMQYSPTLQALDDTDEELCRSCRHQVAATTDIPSESLWA